MGECELLLPRLSRRLVRIVSTVDGLMIPRCTRKPTVSRRALLLWIVMCGSRIFDTQNYFFKQQKLTAVSPGHFNLTFVVSK